MKLQHIEILIIFMLILWESFVKIQNEARRSGGGK